MRHMIQNPLIPGFEVIWASPAAKERMNQFTESRLLRCMLCGSIMVGADGPISREFLLMAGLQQYCDSCREQGDSGWVLE